MLTLKHYDEVYNGQAKFDEAADNYHLLQAYGETKRAGNAILSFCNGMYEEDAGEIADILRETGTREFTISGKVDIKTLEILEAHGFVIACLVHVNSPYTYSGLYGQEGHEIVPALLLKLMA